MMRFQLFRFSGGVRSHRIHDMGLVVFTFTSIDPIKIK